MPDVKLHCALTGVLLAGLALCAQATPPAAVTGPALPPPVAIPVPADLPADTLNLARLERIQSDTLLYEAQGARAKALLSLQQNNGYDASVPSALTQTLLAPAPGKTPDPATTVRGSLPRIAEIAGSGKQLRARLVLADGAGVEVVAGQRVPGSGHTVKHITAQEVQVTTAAGETHTLAFTE